MKVLAVVLCLLLSLAVADAAAQVTSTFDFGLEGWLIIGDNAGGWVGVGGNPDGFLNVADLATGAINIASAPPKFLGDWSAMTSTDTLAFDVHFVNTSGGALVAPSWIFRIEGPGGAATGITPGVTPPQGVWSTFKVSLDPADWTIVSGTWGAILADVTALKLYVEYVNGDEEVRVDNVSLSSTPITVFNPCAHSHFNGTGLDDWSFENTGTVSNPGDDGNGLGYLRILDLSSVNSYALSPARFQGDWSTLDNNGCITIDIRVISSSGNNFGATEFIRLTGPGGSAYVSLAPGDVPTAPRMWKTFEFPLSESEWTVDSGTWAGLLAEVLECRIDAEFFDGTETIGIDNFGRMAKSCPPIDVPITVYPSELTLCRTYGLLDPRGLALNPATSTLHALIREEGAANDGLYTVLGPNPGIRAQAYDRPAGLLFSAAGDGFISEDFDGQVFRYSGGISTLWVQDFHSGDDDPFGMTVAPPGFSGPNVNPGDILVCDRGFSGPDQIWAFSPDSTGGERLVVPDPGNVDWWDVTSRSDGTVWVIDEMETDSIFVVHPTGVLTGVPLSSSINGMVSIVHDPGDDLLYVGARGSQSVHSIDPATGDVTLVADGFTNLGRTGLEIGPAARRLWVSDHGYDRVYEICLSWATAAGDEPPRAPSDDLSLRAVPNPFNPTTRIMFVLPVAERVSLDIYDATGRRVRTLVSRQLPAGSHSVAWDGRDERGQQAASGVYFSRLRAGDAQQSVKMLLLK